MKPIIEAKEISRWYGIVMGLNNISFTIEPGLTGLVGPNGAGKSTLIQIITGQIQPSSGVLTVFGEEPFNHPALLRRIGYCPEKEALHEDMKPLDWLKSLAMISGIHAGEASDRAEQMLERVQLPRQHWNRSLKRYSKGMRQRVKLAQGLIHDPELLVLDEPMNGLDPMGRQEIGTILKDLASKGVSILVSSHILPELESLCKNILILSWGRVIASGHQQSIRADLKHWSEQLTVECSDRQALVRCLFDAGVLKGFRFDSNPQAVHIEIEDAEAFYARWTQFLRQDNLDIFSIRSRSRSLKNIFDKVTSE